MPVEVIAAFFIASNVIVGVLYTLMVFFPRAAITKKVMGSLWSIAAPAILHTVFAFTIIAFRPGFTQEIWRQLYVENGLFGASTVALISNVYGTYPEAAVLHGWVHIVAGDMMMARWVYFDGPERGMPTWVTSLFVLLIGYIGPIGFTGYLGVRWLMGRAKTTTPDAAKA